MMSALVCSPLGVLITDVQQHYQPSISEGKTAFDEEWDRRARIWGGREWGEMESKTKEERCGELTDPA